MNLGQFGKSVLGVLSGGSTVPQYSYDQSGNLQVTQQPLSTSQMFRNMFAGMLAGLAGGIQANRAGMHGGLAALAGGAQASSQMWQQQDLQKRQQALTQFQTQQQAQRMAIERGDYMLRLAQERRAQAKFLQDSVEHKLRVENLELMNQRDQLLNNEIQREQVIKMADDTVKLATYWKNFVESGYKQVITKEFDNWQEATDYAKRDPRLMGHLNIPMYDVATGKIGILTGDPQVRTFEITIPGTKEKQMFQGTLLDYANLKSKIELSDVEKREKEAQIALLGKEKELKAAQLNEILEGQKEKITKDKQVEEAYKELNAVGGNIEKLSPSSRLALAPVYAQIAKVATDAYNSYVKEHGEPDEKDEYGNYLKNNAQQALDNLFKVAGTGKNYSSPQEDLLFEQIQKLQSQGKSIDELKKIMKDHGIPDNIVQNVIQRLGKNNKPENQNSQDIIKDSYKYPQLVF